MRCLRECSRWEKMLKVNLPRTGSTMTWLYFAYPLLHQQNDMSLRFANEAKRGGIANTENNHCATLRALPWEWQCSFWEWCASPSTWCSTVHISHLKKILSAGNDKGCKDLGAAVSGKSAVLADYGTWMPTPSSMEVSPTRRWRDRHTWGYVLCNTGWEPRGVFTGNFIEKHIRVIWGIKNLKTNIWPKYLPPLL